MSIASIGKGRPSPFHLAGVGLLAGGLVATAVDPELQGAGLIAAWFGFAALVIAMTIGPVGRRGPVPLGQEAAALLAANPNPRAVVDAEGRLIAANPAARALWGNEPPFEAIAAALAADEDQDGALHRLRSAAQARSADSVELALDGAGGIEWWRISVRPLAHPPGAQVWQGEDMTPTRAIAQVLRDERDRLADFLFLAPAGVYQTEAGGELSYVNQKLAQWLGVEAEELLGRPLTAFLLGEERPSMDGAWEGRLVFRGPEDRPMPARVAQVLQDDGGVLLAHGVVLKEPDEEETARGGSLPSIAAGPAASRGGLFDGAPVGIVLVDMEGLVTDANTAFLKLSGRDREGVLGLPFLDLLAEADRAQVQDQLTRVVLGTSAGAEAEAHLQGPEEPTVALFVGPMDDAEDDVGSPSGLVVHCLDMTQQKTLERQFAQAQKMQAMGQLAGGVAHDFNNLLTAMIGFCDLLLQRHTAGDPSFADIMQIRQNANRAANLVRQLLAFARRQPLKTRLIDVTEALAELSHLLRRLMGETIVLRLSHGRDLGLVRVDPGQLDQVIINLAVNARDAMPGGGVLSISTRSERLRAGRQSGAERVPAGTYVVIEVADTGVGISADVLPRIFEPFFTTKHPSSGGSGSGLGLSTVYGIVRQTEGYILVDSTPGEGTRFQVFLPVAEARAEAEAPPAPAVPEREAPRPATATLLLVEDEDAVRVFAARALRQRGHTVIEATSGEQALDLMAEGTEPDLVITDMVMPGMDGGTLARLIRQERPDIRLILMSGYSDEMIAGDPRGLEGAVFVPKPFTLQQLVGVVAEALAAPELG